jgi:hypothetical protein
MKGNKNALWALAAAGGLWAWQNRDKIQGWMNDQRNRLNDQMNSQQSNQYGTNESFTGETRRMSEHTYDTPDTTTPNRTDPFTSNI